MPLFTLPGAEVNGLNDARIIAHDPAWEIGMGALAFTFTVDDPGGRQGLISKDAVNFGTGGHLTIWQFQDTVLLRLQSETMSIELSGGAVEAGTEHAVAVNFGDGGLELHFDGELVAESDYDGGLVGNREPLVIGASQWGSIGEMANALTHEFGGSIGETAIFDERLSDAAIRALAGPGAGTPSTPAPQPEPESPAPDVDPADPSPSASSRSFEAEDFDATRGVGVYSYGDNRQIGSTQDGEWVRYDAVDFGSDPTDYALELTLASGSSGGTVEVRTGAPDGALLASYATPSTGGWDDYDEVTLDLGTLTGSEDLYFVFRGGASSIMDIDAFTLVPEGSGAPDTGTPAPPAPSAPEPESGPTTGGGASEPTPGNGGAGPVTLRAARSVIENDGFGESDWGAGVTISALDGKQLVFDDQFINRGFGVDGPGSRWKQIDYLDIDGGTGEGIQIDLNQAVDELTLTIGQLGLREGPGGAPETGKWTALAANGDVVSEGLIGPEFSTVDTSNLPRDAKVGLPHEIETDEPFEVLIVEATQFGYGSTDFRTQRYLGDFFTDSSDFNILSLEFVPEDSFLS